MVTDTTHIEAKYNATLQFDLSDCDVKLEDIKTYWIKFGTLHIEMKDGSQKSFEPRGDFEPDYKWPTHIQEWAEDDKGWKESIRPIIEEERIIIQEEEIKEEED